MPSSRCIFYEACGISDAARSAIQHSHSLYDHSCIKDESLIGAGTEERVSKTPCT